MLFLATTAARAATLAVGLVGESQGHGSQLDRVVTADDFRLIARAVPGVGVGRATAKPSYAIAFGVTVSDKGAVEKVVPTSVFTNENCA